MAVRSQWAKQRTLMSGGGRTGINVSVKLSKMSLADEQYTIPQELKKNGYSTGMVGKWHLANSYYEICDILDSEMNATLYDYCTGIPKMAGFDFVDGYYPNNIASDSQAFGHNPEWMLHNAKKFINNSVNVEKKPFFLYFSHTLTHEPWVYDSLFRFSIRDTPKGELKGDDIPSDTGMWSRPYLWEQVMEAMDNGERLNAVAAGMWMDNSLGALTLYLQQMGLYDDTMIIFLNDHGMMGKFTLYEQGTRVMQIIRYPKLFKAGSVMPDHFITSTAHLADIIFELSKTEKDEKYVTDSVNWVQDAIDIMSGEGGMDYDDEIGPYRFADMYNSHAIYSQKWKYIWRANQLFNREIGPNYPNCADYEQLYDLENDPIEQINLINDESLSSVIHKLRELMVDYIYNVACPFQPHLCDAPPLHEYGEGFIGLNKDEEENDEDDEKSNNWLKHMLM